MNEIDAENIRKHLRTLTAKPHLAGTPADKEQAEGIKQFWEKQGLKSWLTPYEVLLSYPKENNPNKIELQDGSGNAIFTTQLAEKILRPEQNQSDVVPPFNAFSGKGMPEGPLVYVNYGRVEDFTWLKEEKNMDFTGKICIARYGKIFRGDKAHHAEIFGAAGMILYSDPHDYANPGSQDAYPDSWWLPATGVQRGSLSLEGDALTQGLPSIESAYRIKQKDAGLLTIPVHPISYGDAQILLQNMTGEEAPEDWRGDLPITYRLGPGFANSEWTVKMFIHTENKIATTYNAFAMIKGSIEPDRYVLMGNHRDAWVFGAVDPSSGTAVMMELSRAVAQMVKSGWRPRRSIIFCSWGAEEFGLIGSREWVEQYDKILSDRAVAYLNVDIAVQGNFTFRARALPIVENTLYEVGKVVPNPDEKEKQVGRKTLFDTWAARYPAKDSNGQNTGLPRIPILGSGSDHAPFINKVGVTCIDMRYHFDESLGLSSYPLYHSVYETFHLVNEIMDPTFAFHKATAQYVGELARQLADSYVLPYDIREYGKALRKYQTSVITNIQNSDANELEAELAESLRFLDEAIFKMTTVSEAFYKRIQRVNRENPLEVRMINDQMLKLERAFINPSGLPGRPFTRNVIFAPSAHDSYAGSSFPGLVDTLFEIHKLTGEDFTERLEEVKKQFSIVTFHIQSAAALLQEYDNFQYS